MENKKTNSAIEHYYLYLDISENNLTEENISKGNFRFVSYLYLRDILNKIDMMPQDTFDKIIEKHVEMNIAHPFFEGNGRSPIKDTEIKLLLNNALTNNVNNRQIYMKGMDASYNYEGYNNYFIEVLAKENN